MGTVRKGKVKLTEKEKAMGLKKAQAGGECRPGRPIDYNESEYINGKEYHKFGYKKNKIIFTEKRIEEIWNGTRPLEDINHEVIHANDMLDASWWGDPNDVIKIYNSPNPANKINQWLEINALKINYKNTGDKLYLKYLNNFLPW